MAGRAAADPRRRKTRRAIPPKILAGPTEGRGPPPNRLGSITAHGAPRQGGDAIGQCDDPDSALTRERGRGPPTASENLDELPLGQARTRDRIRIPRTARRAPRRRWRAKAERRECSAPQTAISLARRWRGSQYAMAVATRASVEDVRAPADHEELIRVIHTRYDAMREGYRTIALYLTRNLDDVAARSMKASAAARTRPTSRTLHGGWAIRGSGICGPCFGSACRQRRRGSR